MIPADPHEARARLIAELREAARQLEQAKADWQSLVEVPTLAHGQQRTIDLMREAADFLGRAVSPSPTCDCGEKLTQCTSCAVADWQAAHPNCKECCAVSPSPDAQQARIEALEKELAIRREHWTEHESPFHEWAQSYLNSARWAGHDRADAIKTELLERDAQLAEATAKLEKVERIAAHLQDLGERSGTLFAAGLRQYAADLREALASVSPPPLSDAPCSRCGYNGPGYYQPATHPCVVSPPPSQQDDHHDDLSRQSSASTAQTGGCQNDSDILRECGMDGHKWAAAFMRQHSSKWLSQAVPSTPNNGLVDEDDMIAWFCNAIMAGFDEGARREREQRSDTWGSTARRGREISDRWLP